MANKHIAPDDPAVVAVTIKLTRKQRDSLQALAQADRRSLSSYVRLLLDDFLATAPAPKARRLLSAGFTLPEGVSIEQFLRKKTRAR